MTVAPRIVSDELWELVEPLLPGKERRFSYPGRKRLPDRQALQGSCSCYPRLPGNPAECARDGRVASAAKLPGCLRMRSGPSPGEALLSSALLRRQDARAPRRPLAAIAPVCSAGRTN